jgi:hypothetical protein
MSSDSSPHSCALNPHDLKIHTLLILSSYPGKPGENLPELVSAIRVTQRIRPAVEASALGCAASSGVAGKVYGKIFRRVSVVGDLGDRSIPCQYGMQGIDPWQVVAHPHILRPSCAFKVVDTWNNPARPRATPSNNSSTGLGQRGTACSK